MHEEMTVEVINLTDEQIVNGNKLIADYMGKRYDYLICDNCGKPDPELLNDNSRLTKCCSTYDKENENCFYKTTDRDGKEVYSIGKTYSPCNSSSKDLNYHSEWNSIMPVVVKLQEQHSVDIWINYRNTQIEWMDSDNSYDKTGTKSETKLLSIFNAIVRFLTWIKEEGVDLDNPVHYD